MNSTAFQLSKMRRAVRTHGRDFAFVRPGTNDYNEPTGVDEHIYISGLYFESTDTYSFDRTSSEATTMHRKPAPNILCEWSKASSIHIGDTLVYRNNKYNVISIKDVDESGVIGVITLEEVQGYGV